MQPVAPDFDSWILFAFGRPARSDFYPFFDEREEVWDPDPGTAVDFLTRLFEDPSVLDNYDDRQVGGGLWLLSSEDSHALYNRDVPAEARERCVASIVPLFAGLFDRRCAPLLGHLDEPGAGPLNHACYMWWENLAPAALPDDPNRERLEARMLDVMAAILDLANPACQESALHGLGHAARHTPKRVEAIVDTYLQRQGIRPELADYARFARGGCIL